MAILDTRIDEIGDGIFRLSTWVPDISGFTFDQVLVTGERPFLLHTGMRQLFPLVSAAVAREIPLDALCWISFGHLEADEFGSMNGFLDAAPHAEVIHGPLAIMHGSSHSGDGGAQLRALSAAYSTMMAA